MTFTSPQANRLRDRVRLVLSPRWTTTSGCRSISGSRPDPKQVLYSPRVDWSAGATRDSAERVTEASPGDGGRAGS